MCARAYFHDKRIFHHDHHLYHDRYCGDHLSLLETTELDGGLLSNAAFNASLPGDIGMYMVTIGLIFFSFTTIIGWCYYGERCLVYLFNSVNTYCLIRWFILPA